MIRNVLSLFDGMSCGQQAINLQSIRFNNYYASEIDKHSIKVTMANFPNTIQLGSVVNIDGNDLSDIDLFIGGSPCQSFSFAGKRKGMSTKCETEILTLEHYLELKKEGFEFEGQSYLFWEYIRLLRIVKPKYFLLENVMMTDKWNKVLSKAIGVNPIELNSSSVSAQTRKRLYWTNIGLEPKGLFGYLESTIHQPKDKGILLKDIIEENVSSKYDLKPNVSKLIDENSIMPNGVYGYDLRRDEGLRCRLNQKSGTLLAQSREDGTAGQVLISVNGKLRRATPIECERLQTVKDGYTNHVTESQRYKMLGNGWTVDIISHILSFINE